MSADNGEARTHKKLVADFAGSSLERVESGDS